MQNFTIEELRLYVWKHVVSETYNTEVHDTIASVIKAKWEGKKLNKRFADQVKEALRKVYPAKEWASVVYNPPGSFSCATLNLYNWPFLLPESSYWSIYLGYAEDVQAYTLAKFEEKDICRGSAAKERLASYHALLEDTERLNTIVDAVNKLRHAYIACESIQLPDCLYLDTFTGLKQTAEGYQLYRKDGE